jgi:hypothetical protein
LNGNKENKMTVQTYLQVDNSTNIVTTSVIWDGDTDTWPPPPDTTMLVQATTPAMIWEAVIVDEKVTDYVLVQKIGAGEISFTWDSTTQVLTTNQPKPAIPVQSTQPVTTGTQSA